MEDLARQARCTPLKKGGVQVIQSGGTAGATIDGAVISADDVPFGGAAVRIDGADAGCAVAPAATARGGGTASRNCCALGTTSVSLCGARFGPVSCAAARQRLAYAGFHGDAIATGTGVRRTAVSNARSAVLGEEGASFVPCSGAALGYDSAHTTLDGAVAAAGSCIGGAAAIWASAAI